MVGPLLERLGLELIETYWTPDGNFPDHEPNPLLPENRQFIIEQVRSQRRRPRHRLGRRRRPLLLHRRHRRSSSTATSSPRCSPSRCSRKHPGEAILYDVRASRAVADTVTRAGGTPYINRVGHAFFKTRMREEGSLFGGEVSGHYYFRDFYCADSGTIPALLVLELLSRDGQVDVASCSRPTARATSSPARSTPRSPTRRRRWRRSPRATPTREQKHLDGISIDYDDWHFNVRPSNTEPLLRLCLESLVSPRGHGTPPRRGARADPLVSDAASPPDASRRAGAAGARGRGRHPPPGDPHAVPGRARQRLPDRGLAAHAGRLGPQLGQGAGRARAGARRARPRDRGHRAAGRSPTSTSTTSAWPRSSRGARAPRSRRSTALAPFLRDFGEAAELDDRFAERMMLRHGIPPDVVTRAARRLGELPRLGLGRGGHAPAARRRGAAAARPHAAGAPPPRPQPLGHRLPRRVSARCCSRPTT